MAALRELLALDCTGLVQGTRERKKPEAFCAEPAPAAAPAPAPSEKPATPLKLSLFGRLAKKKSPEGVAPSDSPGSRPPTAEDTQLIRM